MKNSETNSSGSVTKILPRNGLKLFASIVEPDSIDPPTKKRYNNGYNIIM